MSPSTEFVPFALPSIGREEEEAVLAVLRSGWLTTGKVARAFEEEFAAFVGSTHALAVNSATSGLHLALEALGVGPGDTVITSPYTFTSTAAVVRHLGAEVRFCDVGKEDYNLDPEFLGKALVTAGKVKAVIPVHIGGLPCRMDEILDPCGRLGVPVLEDAAHAFPSRLPVGSRAGEGTVGTLGTIGAYSFYATKTITTGEGGMVVTDDRVLAARMARMRMHGIDREVWDRYTSKSASWYYGVVEAGYKYNMPDLLAAIGREQLKKADRFLGERRAIAAAYGKAFAAIEGIELPPDGPGHAWHLYAIRLRRGAFRVDRAAFIEALKERGIGASVHFIPLHLMEYWSSRYGLDPEDFPEALDKYERSISLPIWQGMDPDQVGRVAAAVAEVAAELGA